MSDFATQFFSKDNFEVDFESRRLETETKHSPLHTKFQDITAKLGKPEIDLYASQTNTKCNLYYSWKRDPGALKVDAFTQDWRFFFFYVFRPFSIIFRVWEKNRLENRLVSSGMVPHLLYLCKNRSRFILNQKLFNFIFK